MELFEVLDFINKNKKSIFLMALLFGFIGLGTYFLFPRKYIAIGSFYVQRATENSSGKYFTYEGYYSQQTALAYTNTFIGFLESEDTKKNALQNLNISATEQNLRALGKQIQVKKNAPQIITLTIKGNSPTAVEKLWKFIAEDSLIVAKELNQTGDSALQIAQIGDPVVKEQYSNLVINTLAGLGTGLFIGIFATAFAQYRKETRKV